MLSPSKLGTQCLLYKSQILGSCENDMSLKKSLIY